MRFWTGLAASTALASIASIMIDSQVSAADMQLKAPRTTAAPVWSWTGLYGGIHGGYGWGTSVFRTRQDLGAFGGAFAPASSSFEQDIDGGAFGGHIGFNQQYGSYVVGLEASLTRVNIGSVVQNVFPPIAGETVTYSTDIDWLAAITPRLGFAAGNSLLYVKGGLAAGRAESKLSTTRAFGGPAPRTFREKTDHIGWTIGAGIEYALTPNWILGVEYNYIDLGRERYGGLSYLGNGVPTNLGDYELDLKISTITGRLSYKLDAPASSADRALPPAAFLWSGFYGGVHGGYGWSDAEYLFAYGFGGVFGLPANAAGAPQPAGFNTGLRGAVFGGHLGFNHQLGNWVVGLEGSFDWSGIDGTVANAIPGTRPGARYATSIDWMATVTPRIGFVSGSWFVYGKGGLAAARVNS
jgi:outer membrane immunogenic protein